MLSFKFLHSQSNFLVLNCDFQLDDYYWMPNTPLDAKHTLNHTICRQKSTNYISRFFRKTKLKIALEVQLQWPRFNGFIITDSWNFQFTLNWNYRPLLTSCGISKRKVLDCCSKLPANPTFFILNWPIFSTIITTGS